MTLTVEEILGLKKNRERDKKMKKSTRKTNRSGIGK
jgi:hypothetical protein